MQKYEMTIVLPEKATKAKKKSVKERIEKLVKTLEGKLGKENDWGKIELAYEIKDETTGSFLHYPLELEPERVKEVGNKLKLDEDIIRYLLVKAE